MKIVHVFTAPQSAYFFLEKQLEYFGKKGYVFDVIIPNDQYFSDKFVRREHAISTHYISIHRKVSIFSDLKSLFDLYFMFLKIKGDIIHLHTPKASFIGGLAARLAFQKVIIFQMHGLVSINKPKIANPIYLMEKLTCRLSTHILAVSHSLSNIAINYKYCKANKINVLANGTINGIDSANKFNPQKAGKYKRYIEKTRLKDKFVLGFVGRLSIEKGFEDYLQVFKMLRKVIPVLGVIVGPNELNINISVFLKKFNLSEKTNDLIVFDQILDPQNIMCDFDVLLLPTKREGFGLVAAEANSLQVPVVAYNIPGIMDAIDNNKTGILVEYGNVKKLYRAVMEYYNNPQKKSEHGINGRKRVKMLYDQKFVWNELLKEYQSLVN